ncbi:OmpA family protein [bacterium AH-315-L15]|nr:OmpA family protein [bacterium AH-315-L15]
MILARKKKVEADEGKGGFLVMMVSLNLILVIFFIFLNSLGVDDEDKRKKALGSLIGKFGLLPSGLQITKGHKVLLPGASFAAPPEKGVSFSKEFRKIMTGGIYIPKEVNVTTEGRNIVINLADKVLFDTGKAEVIPRAADLLDDIAAVLKRRKRTIFIEGYTDNIPISTPRHPSNWELSAARASAVKKYLVNNGGVPRQQLTAVGYGEYKPLVPNNKPENRARNRRVRIVILPGEL